MVAFSSSQRKNEGGRTNIAGATAQPSFDRADVGDRRTIGQQGTCSSVGSLRYKDNKDARWVEKEPTTSQTQSKRKPTTNEKQKHTHPTIPFPLVLNSPRTGASSMTASTVISFSVQRPFTPSCERGSHVVYGFESLYPLVTSYRGLDHLGTLAWKETGPDSMALSAVEKTPF